MGKLHIDAQRLAKLGYRVLPADKVKKVPAMWLVGLDAKWKKWQTEDSAPYLMRWFGKENAKIALCVLTGQPSGRIVLDIDSPEAYDYWAGIIGEDVMQATAYARTQSYEAKGGGGVGHYHFLLEDGQAAPQCGQPKSDAELGILWDVRGDGGHVIVPPSIGYTWVRQPEQAVPAPGAFLEAVRTRKEANGADREEGERTGLAGLLADPPEGEGSGRNNWLTQVAGHYAKLFPFRDAFDLHVRQANTQLSEPLPDAEVDKMIESIWETEHRKGQYDFQVSADSGWLVTEAGSKALLVQCRAKVDKGEDPIRWDEFGDFNLEAMGVVEDEHALRTYDIVVHRKRRGDALRRQLPAATLADPRKMKAWLGEHGVGVAPPDHAWPRMAWDERLRRWIEAQDPPKYKVVGHLGWNDGTGFVTHEGVITTAGLADFTTHRPDPKLANWAPYRYGFHPEAIEVLREVMLYHHERVSAVFSAWWIAALLKPQIAAKASLFPFMALEAPSESGKTTGFFSLMLALSGNTVGQVVATKAALRDMVGAHSSGIVWVDDMDSIQGITELLRAATGDGTTVKKGEDNTGQVEAHLVAPVVVSGEALQLGHQKALLDRCVSLDVPSPTQRRSAHNPERLQWDDILELRRRCPDLTVFAGTIVQEVLKRVDMLTLLPGLRPPSGGRWADKIAIVRLGARILADVTGDEWVIRETDAWASEQVNLGDENTLTLKLIPEALRLTDYPEKPIPPHDRWPVSPVVLREGLVYFSPAALAKWWHTQNNGRVEERTETVGALIQQAKVLKLDQQRKTNIRSIAGTPVKYWVCGPELSEVLLQRARDEVSDGGSSAPAPAVAGHEELVQEQQRLAATYDPSEW